ncbi:restriction endonuclease subunit S [Lachnospiraceae bacterium 38-10]
MKIELGKIYNISSGGTPSKKCGEYYKDGNIKWVKTGDLKEKYLYDTDECITEKGLQSSSAKLYEPDTVLIAMYGATIGATSILKLKACTNQACAAFCKNDKIMPEYLYYFFKSQKEKFIKDGVGGAQPNISIGYLRNIRINLISIDEQREIVENLGKIEELICNEQEQIRQFDVLIKSRFIEMFGDPFTNPKRWEKGLLGDVCDVRDGTHDSPQYYNEGYPLLTSKNITSGKIDLSNCNYISEEDFIKINERSKVDIGDIIMPMIGTVGKPLIVDIQPDFAIKNVALIKFGKAVNVRNIYIKALLESDYFDRSVISKIRGGTQKFIALGDIRKLEILLPTMDMQQKFEDFAIQVDGLKVTVQKSLDKIQLLFDSLMQEYFG